jgi:hypothetical protein
MMSHLCNRCVREFLILARTWFAFDLPSKTGCDSKDVAFVSVPRVIICVRFDPSTIGDYFASGFCTPKTRV